MNKHNWIKPSHSEGSCKGRQQRDECAKRLAWLGKIKQIGFHVTTKCNNVFYLFSLVRKCIGLHEVVIIINNLVHYNEFYIPKNPYC